LARFRIIRPALGSARLIAVTVANFNQMCLVNLWARNSTDVRSDRGTSVDLEKAYGTSMRDKGISPVRLERSVWFADAARLAALGAVATSLLLPLGGANAEEWPVFRKGVWQFERTLKLNERAGFEDQNRVVFKHEMRRCVNPSESMKETFRAVS